MTKKTFLVNGNPKTESFTKKLADTYHHSAQQNFEVRRQDLALMDFDPNLNVGYDTNQPLEKDLVEFQNSILWADHLVLLSPIWWGGPPAKLKGLFDRSFLPGFAFKYVKGQTRPDQLLKGKSARLIMLMDSPPWYFRFVQGAPGVKMLKNNTLKFSGFNQVKTSFLGPIIHSDEEQRGKWINTVQALGEAGK